MSNAVLDAAKARALAAAAGNVIKPTKILTQEEMLAGMMELPSIKDEKDLGHEKVIAYGDPFSGKTVLAALLSEFYHVLLLDGDNGIASIKTNLPSELQSRILSIHIPATTAHPIFLHTMLKVVTGRQTKICLSHGAVDCPPCKSDSDAKHLTVALNQLPRNWIVVMDNLNSFTSCCISHAVLKATGKSDVPEDYKLELDDWGRVKNLIDKLGPYIRDEPYNFVALSHPIMVEKEDKRKLLVPLAGSDKSSPNFAKNFGHEVYCKLDSMKHQYFSATTYNSQIQTGSRSNIALEKQDTPSLLHFFRPHDAKELLKGSYNEWFFGDRKQPAPKPKGILEL